MSIEKNNARWMAAAHGMQSGVALELNRDPSSGTPKHLRVGVNAAMSDHAGLAYLLIRKGIITLEEYTEAIADQMEIEQKMYELRLGVKLG